MDELDLKPSRFRVLLHLWRRADRGGKCFPGAETIAQKCRITRDTVWASLRELEARGLLVRGKSGNRNSNVYRLKLPGSIDGKDGPIKAVQPAETAGDQMAETAGLQSAEEKGREGSPSEVPQLRESGSLSSYSEDDHRTISERLNLSRSLTSTAIDAFLAYKRPFPNDPRDAAAVVQWFQASTPGKAWMRGNAQRQSERNRVICLPEPEKWRDWAQAEATDPSHADRPWQSFDASAQAHIAKETAQWLKKANGSP